MKFYFIAKSTNKVTIPDTASESWGDVYSLNLNQPARHQPDTPITNPQQPTSLPEPPSQEETPCTHKRKRNNYVPNFSLLETEFFLKLNQLRLAWKTMYGDDEKFPSDVIIFKDILKVILPPAPHHKIHLITPSTTQRENIKAYDTEIHGLYNKQRETVITKIQQTMYKNDCRFVAALKKNMT